MKIQGCYVALATPFNEEGALDEKAYRLMIRRQIKGGSDGLVPCGSTGEAATLTHEEYRRCIEICMEEAQGDIPVFAGLGTNATWKAIEMAREAESLGADGLLVLTPYYNKPTQEGLYQHFSAIARQSRLPIMLYNIPSRTAVTLSPTTTARLAKNHKNIVAVKDATGSLDQVSETLRLCGSQFTVMAGDDSMTLPMMVIGAKGVVSVVANITPKEMAALTNAALKGDYKTAQKIHLKLYPLIKALFIETNPIPVKMALHWLGFCTPEMRLPLTKLSGKEHPILKNALKEGGYL